MIFGSRISVKIEFYFWPKILNILNSTFHMKDSADFEEYMILFSAAYRGKRTLIIEDNIWKQ